MAKLSFSNAYRINTGTTPAAKEANSADFIFTPLNVTRIDDRSAGQNFSGNDVVVELQVDGQIYYGWISRPVKSGGVVRGFYFWTDPQFTSLAAATADGNADGDGNSADNFGFVLVVDQAWFNALPAIGANVKNAGTSSDRVDNGLNALMPVNSAPAPMNDSVSFMEDGGAQGGNVLSNDSDANGDGLTVSGYSIGGVAGTLGVAHTIAGVGSFTLNADGAYTFAPADDYAGPVPLISYSMADGRGGTGAASLSISVAQANDAPSGADKTITARENIGHTFTAADFGFSDSTDSVANSLLSVTIATAPNAADGTLTLNGVTVGAGDSIAAADITSLKFIPAPDRSGLGLASFTFQVRDNGGGAGDTDLTPNTIIFNVSNVNSAPGAVADTARATEGGAGTAGSNPSGNLLANDTDPDAGDLKTVDSASGAGSGATAIGASNAIAGSFGTLTLSSDGSYAYALDNTSTAVQALRSSAQTLTDTFSYTMKDGAGLRSTASMTVTIEGRNDGPVALNDFNFAVASNVVQAKLNPSGKLLANDSDVDAGDAISVTRASAGSTLGGAIVTIGSGTSVQGAEGRTYAGFSTKGAGNIGSVGATVTGTGVPAGTTVASVDNVSGTRFVTFANAYGNVAALDGVASITVNGNLFTLEPLGAPSTTIIAISGATGGAISAGMTVTGAGIQAATTVASVAASGSVSFVTLNKAVSGALGADVVFGSSGTSIAGSHGTLMLQQDGSYTYTITDSTPTAGSDTFSYEITDAAGAVSTARLSLDIIVSNVAPPVAAPDTVAITENAAAVSANVLANDTQNSGVKVVSDAWSATAGAMTAVTVAGVSLSGLYGALLIKPDGSTTYTLNNGNGAVNALRAGQSLSESFSYRMGSNTVGYDVETLTITISGANDGPSAFGDSATAREAGGLANTSAGFDPAGNVLLNDADPDSGDAKTVTMGGVATPSGAVAGGTTSGTGLVITGTYGALRLGADGSYSYVVDNTNATVQALGAASAGLTDSFSYRMRDTAGSVSDAVMVLTVTGANDAPVNATPAAASVAEGASAAIPGLSVGDVDDASLNVALSAGFGALTIGALNGAAISAGANGSATLTLSGSPASLNLALATLSYQGAGQFSGTDTLSILTTDAAGLVDLDTVDITVTPDNRLLTVTAPTVNEASQYAVFSVAGAAGQQVTLALAETGGGAGRADDGADFASNLEYFDGAAWQAYAGNTVALPAGGTLFVRVAVLADLADEGAETFQLTAANKAGSAASAVATIVDNGTGLVYSGGITGGIPDSTTAGRDDDRALAVTSVSVNENSPYAVFTLTGAGGQAVGLALVNGSATDADHGAGIEYFDGAAWQNYAGSLTLPAGGAVFLRTSIATDAVYEGPESFAVVATNLSGRAFVGNALISDDGTGTVYPGTISGGMIDTSTAGLDNDLALAITAYGPINEASGYAMFSVTATAGEVLTLTLAASGNTPAATAGFTMEFSTDGASWTAYDSSTQPVAPAGGVVFVRISISSEHDAVFEGAEAFQLTAAIGTGSGKIAAATTAIVDDGTGSRYDGTIVAGTPVAATNGLDYDTGVDNTAPAIAVASDMATLAAGQTATISFILSEPSTTFSIADIAVTGGLLSGFTGNGASYSAMFTPDAGSTTAAVISVASAVFTDAAGNANTDGADSDNTVSMSVNTVVTDTAAPTIAIASDMAALGMGQTAAISFTLSEPSTSFAAADISVSGGTLSGFTGSGTSYSALFTPTADSTAAAVISVASNAFTDAAGNANADGGDTDNTVSMAVSTFVPDTTAPTISITSDMASLGVGQTAAISFTLSEPSATFTDADILVTGGILSGLTGNGASYTALFTPTAGSTTAAVISVASNAFTDAAGNANADGGDTDNTVSMAVSTFVPDTTAPTISITSDMASLGVGQTAAISFTLSEPSATFTDADILVTGGTLSGLTGNGTSYTALFTPTAGSTTAAVISVASNAYTDAAGNANADGGDTDNTVTMAVNTVVPDTTAPTIAITSDMAALGVGQTAAISFTLSEPSTSFTEADISVSGGTLSGFTGSGASYSALFTPTGGSTMVAVISVASNAFADAAGNANADGADTDNTVSMAVNTVVPDTTAPSIAIASNMASLSVGQTAAISFTLSEPSATFTDADILVTGGTLSGLTGNGTSYTALFTPTAGSTTAAVISVASNAYTDAAGNANADGGDTDNTVTMAVNTVVPDTTAPTIAITSDMAALGVGQTAAISFTLSEPSTSFTEADISVSGGTLSGFTGSGASYSALFTPTGGSTMVAVISVASNAFADAAGNANADGADTDNTVSMAVNTVVPDTTAPSIAIASNMASLSVGQTAAISFTLSEPSATFTDADILVTGGTLSGLTGNGTSYTALFTPTAGSTTAAVISVASNAYTDAAGNANADGGDTDNTVTMAVNTVVPDTTAPTIAITSDMAALGVGQTAAISFTLSEPSTSFTEADISVSGGTLSGFTGSGASYSALFTPTGGSTMVAVISVASNAFADAAGNANADGADTDNTVSIAVNTVVPDTTAPTIAITSDMAALGVGQTAAISFTLSEPSTSFTEADISVSGGTLSGFTGSGASYSALFTPTGGSTMVAVISVASNAFADAAGNANADGADTDNTVSMAVNTVVPDITAPTVVITSNATALLAGQSTSITFTLSESSTSFTAADVAVTGGTLSGFTGSGANYSATFSAGPLTNANATISVASASFTDAAGNANAVGGQTSVQVTRAALTAPTIAIAEDSNNDGRLNTAELAGDVDVIITLPTGALAGDVLTVSDGSATRTIVLTGQSIASGSVFTAFAPPARGAAISVSASISEAGGQPGAIAQDSAQRGSGAVFAITGVSSDTGIVGDLVTTDNTLVLSGTAETGTVVKVMLGGVLLGTTVAANDSWEFDNTANPLPNGDNVLTVTADDLPGQMPAIVVRVFSADLNPVSDDGANNTDHRTSITMPDFILKASGIMATGDTARLVDASGAVIGSSAVTAANVASGQVNVTTQPLDDGAYIFLAQIVGADGQVKVADQVTVTIITDQDGVKPSVELAANGGDFNHDGLFDWQQNNLAQLPLTSLEAFVAGINAPDSSFGAIMAGAINAGNPGAPVLLDAGAQLLNVAVSAQPAPLPANTTAATPMFEFSVTGYDGQALRDIAPSIPGLQTRVIIDLPAGVQANTFLKFDPAAQSWYTFKDDQNLATFDDGATLLDTNADGLVDRIVVTLTDGARGDEDGIANGVVVDPGMLAFQSANPVYSILLAGGDRFYTTNAAEAAQYATGAGNVFEGARFDSLSAGDGGRKMYASYQQYTRDWWFGADQQPAPYICYERVSTASGFFAAGASGSVGEKFHLFMDGAGITQLVTQAQASTLGLATKGYTDKGAQFSTTTNSAFAFDAEGYLVANRGNADVQAFVRTLAGKFQHSSDVGFVEAVEQHYLGQVAIVGLAHGGAASAAELNTAFGTSFLG